MKKFIVLTLALSVLANVLFGQKVDVEAKKILDAVSAKFKTYASVVSKFSIKIENNAGKNLGTKAGNFFMKGNKYKVSATNQEQFSDGANTWTFDKGSNEVTINKADVNAITPQKLFTNFYDKDYIYKLNGTAKGRSEIELTPLDKSKPIFKIYLYIANNAISSMKLLEKTGNRYLLTISSVKTNTAVSETQFVFNAKNYPGVEVVDLR
jgi:outer membrane lipoprotein carrier protein